MEHRQAVSCIVPVQNGSRFVKPFLQNLDLILRPQDELIIVDDFSTDDTRDLLKKYSRGKSNIKIVKNRKRGIVNALNFGLAISEFELVARFDIDDLYESSRLDKQVSLFDDDTVAVFSDYTFVGDSTIRLGYMPSAIFSQAIKVSLVSGRRTAHPGSMFRKSIFEYVGGYREEDEYVEDLFLWARMAREGNFKSIDEPLLNYRIHSKAITTSKRKYMKSQKRKVISLFDFRKLYFSIMNDVSEQTIEYRDYNRYAARTMHLAIELFKISKIIDEKTTINCILHKLEFPRSQFKLELCRFGLGAGFRKFYRNLV